MENQKEPLDVYVSGAYIQLSDNRFCAMKVGAKTSVKLTNLHNYIVVRHKHDQVVQV